MSRTSTSRVRGALLAHPNSGKKSLFNPDNAIKIQALEIKDGFFHRPGWELSGSAIKIRNLDLFGISSRLFLKHTGAALDAWQHIPRCFNAPEFDPVALSDGFQFEFCKVHIAPFRIPC